MQSEASSGRSEAVAPRPLAELLQCPPVIGNLLNRAAVPFAFEPGARVFSQFDLCRGLYLVISGQFQRRTERVETRLSLGPVRAGELVELAAALGRSRHTYTLSAVTPASVLMLPVEALHRVFEAHPPLRMQLLEELAREVSRAYEACTRGRFQKPGRHSSAVAE
jgi:CRP-like cAMP-binding protein